MATSTLFKRRIPVPTAEPFEAPDAEWRPRRRLSKPLTGRPTTGPSAFLHQRGDNRTLHEPILSPSPIKSTTRQTRELIKSHVFEDESAGKALAPPTSTRNELRGVAYMINNFEARSTSTQPPLSPSPSLRKDRRPLTAVFGNRRVSSHSIKGSKPDITVESPLLEVHPSESRETLGDVSSAPPYHRSPFIAGAATRADRQSSTTSNAQGSAQISIANDRQDVFAPSKESSSKTAATALEDDWRPPPPPLIARTETPTNLEYTHLGGLRLGSLHVTNGRASPAPSQLSRHLLVDQVSILRRDASSEYAESEYESVVATSTPPQSPQALVQTRIEEVEVEPLISLSEPQTPTNAHGQLHRRYAGQSAWNHEPPKLVVTPRDVMQRKPVGSPDRTSLMAMQYMAEMPDSPYSIQRSCSPTGSVIRSPSKATDFEVEVFDGDEAVPASGAWQENCESLENLDASSGEEPAEETATETCVEPQRQPSPDCLKPPLPSKPSEQSDSGYSSNNSVKSFPYEADRISQFSYETSTGPSVSPIPPEATKKASVKADGKKMGARFFRPSILKQSRSTAPVLPTFVNLNKSTTTVATTNSAPAITPEKPQKSKKLQKLRRRSQPTLASIGLGHKPPPVSQEYVPEVPAAIASNLAIRSKEVPELQHTFKTMHHTKESIDLPERPFKPVQIRFPSPEPTPERTDETPSSFNLISGQSRIPLPQAKRESFLHRAKGDRGKSQERVAGGISQTEAMAIIHDFGTVSSSLGVSPYDAAREKEKQNQVKRESVAPGVSPHSITNTNPRPKSMMDADTAAEVARLRSRTIFERDNPTWGQKRLSFDDRGGIPGKNVRPTSWVADAPPLPPLPMLTQARGSLDQQWRRSYQPPSPGRHATHERRWQDHAPPSQHQGQSPQQQHWQEHAGSTYVPQEQRWQDHAGSDQFERNAPQQRHWQEHTRPDPFERRAPQQSRWEDQAAQEELEPHIPQPTRRQHYGPPLPSEMVFSHPSQWQDYAPHEVNEWPPPPPVHSPRPSFVEPEEEIEELRLAPPPPSHSPRPMTIKETAKPADVWADQAAAWKSRRQSAGEALRARMSFGREDYDQYNDEAVIDDNDIYPEIPLRQPRSTYEPSTQRHSFVGTRSQRFSFFDEQPEEPMQRPLPSRSPSRASQARSFASSIAEDLHPYPANDVPRPSAAPTFGRYSGGLMYGYEHGSGFGGSAGTRSVSGTAEATRKGVPLRSSFGVDLGDVPIIAGLQRL